MALWLASPVPGTRARPGLLHGLMLATVAVALLRSGRLPVWSLVGVYAVPGGAWA